MCNLYTQHKTVDEIAQVFRELQMPLRFPEGVPNLKAADICITDSAPIVRASPGEPGSYDLVVRRWSWPMSGGKPLYNFRSEGRQFPSGHCLVLADGFYEFTAPKEPGQKRKDRWLFTSRNEPMLGIAGLLRNSPEVGEAFTLLTAGPSEDVAPFHGRQIVLLPPTSWRDWLDHTVPAGKLLTPSPAGTLDVRAAPR